MVNRADPEKDALFIRLHNAGASNAELAAAVGIKRDSVRGVRQRLGLNSLLLPGLDPKVHEAVTRLQAEGYTRPEIAAELGVSLDTVSHIRRRLGLPRFAQKPVHNKGKQGPRKIDWEAVRLLTEAGKSAREIAVELKTTKKTVQRIRHELDILQGPPATPYPQEVKDRALAMLDEGMSYGEVGRTLGIPWGRIAKWFPGRGWTPQQTGEYLRLLKAMNKLDPPKDRY